MVINTNLSAQSSANLLMQSSTQLSKSLARLSSGSKVNSPADDSAGLAVSMRLTAQMSRNTAAQNNIGDALALNQTQDGYLSQVTNALDRMSNSPSNRRTSPSPIAIAPCINRNSTPWRNT
jgi:flagellin